MKLSFYRSVFFLGVLCLVLLSIGCSNDTKKFSEISNALAKNIDQLGKEPGITMTGFASNSDNKIFKIGIGIDHKKMTNDRLKQVIESYLTNSASFTFEHDPQKMLEPYNLRIEEIGKDIFDSSLIAEKSSGSTEIRWENINNTQ